MALLSKLKTDKRIEVDIVGLDGSTLNEVLIIDGQQRLTTMYILLKLLVKY